MTTIPVTIKCALSSVAMSALALSIASPAQAQVQAEPQADAGQTPAGEIVVTAQKRQQSLRDVPLAISAMGQDAIRNVGHQDVTGLVNRLPSFQVQQFSPGTVSFNIRGVSQNDFADSQEAPIAFYNDEVYGAALSSISGQNFDLERIEILRGPQGTLFGRNATGGLVQYITAKPTAKLSAGITATIGSYGEVGTDAFISGPLSDTIRARISVSSDDYGGYIKNTPGGTIGSRHFLAGRAQIESDIGTGGLLRLKFQYLRNRNETSAPYSWAAATANADGLGTPAPGQTDFQGYINTSGSPFVQTENNVPRFNREFWSATARYEQTLSDHIQLVSITDYQKVKKTYGEDSDVSPYDVFNYYQDQHQWQASEELRLSGKYDRFNWVAGVYGLVIDANAHAIIQATVPGFLIGTLTAGGPQKTASFAGFGQGDYQLTDTLTLTLGGRYSWDRKRDYYTHAVNGAYSYNSAAAPGGAVFVPVNGVDDAFNAANNPLATQYYRNWSGKLGLEYRPAKDTLFYASINRGTKSGGFDIPNFLLQDGNGAYQNQTIPYKQEVLTNYEGGFKVSAFDRKVDVSGAVFHYDYKNYQAFIIQGLTAVITNLPAKVDGQELEINFRPAKGVQMGGFVTHLHTKISNVTLPSGRVTDREMPQAPAWSVGANASYSTDVMGTTATLSTDWRYDGGSYFATFNAPIDYEPGHIVGNLRLNVTYRQWTVGVFANNVLDKYYRVYDLDNSLSLGSAQGTYARPRWVGVNLGFRM